MCTKHCKAIGPPPKAITWDHTRQSVKLGVNQANTVMHIHTHTYIYIQYIHIDTVGAGCINHGSAGQWMDKRMPEAP